MAERPQRGLLDTSVIIDIESLDETSLPHESAISAITLAELSAGPHATKDVSERGRRQDRLQRVEAQFDPLPFDLNAARAYGRVSAAVVASGRKARGPRVADLMIAATAIAHDVPLFTRNGRDFRGLEALVDVIEI